MTAFIVAFLRDAAEGKMGESFLLLVVMLSAPAVLVGALGPVSVLGLSRHTSINCSGTPYHHFTIR
jgi:hypothetical protein